MLTAKKPSIIQVQNLNLFYGDKQALKNITMNIEQNQITALIGPSGCGKSTFLRTLNRMNDLIPTVRTTGRVRIMDTEIINPKIDTVSLRQKIGMVFQQPHPFPLSIYDNIAYGPRLHGIKDKNQLNEIVENSLQQAALWNEVRDHLHKSAFSLSGGQQQRLSISRVLAVKPEVILMDEPTSALDPISTAKIENLLVALKKEYTMIIVTHNREQASRISDKTAFFLNGKMVELNDTKTMFTNPNHSQTEAYISGRFG